MFVYKIPKAPGQSIDEVGSFLQNLENNKVIKLIKDNKEAVWVFLLTDIVAHTFYPEYLIEKIRKERMDGKIKKTVAIKHLEFLEKAYKK